ncbi:phosphoglucomutase-2, partial [Aureobasidium melanogenum]
LSPWAKYNELCKQYGYFEDANTYVISPSSEVTNAVFEQIRQAKPTTVGSRKILRWRDLTIGYDSATPDNKPTLPVDKSSQMISCELAGNVHFTVRGSGTEPKIKFYIEGSASSSQEAKASAQEVLEDLMREWFKPEEHGLKRE